jgi:hypothetical protein
VEQQRGQERVRGVVRSGCGCVCEGSGIGPGVRGGDKMDLGGAIYG